MPSQVVLSWVIDVGTSPIGAAAAATRLAAVPLYANTRTDPVLGQFYGLAVESDVTDNPTVTTARRTLTLNMDGTQSPEAPPPFPCSPRTSTPPALPYPLVRAVPLGDGEVVFSVVTGSATVLTGISQTQTVSVGDIVQFLAQRGVFYEVASVNASQIGLTAPYTGKSGSTGAFKEVSAPATRPAFYSTSELDTVAVATVPAIAAGPGARTVELTYLDSTGAGPFVVAVDLTGTRPSAVSFADGGIDVAEIVNIVVETTGNFENSVGQITLVDLAEALPVLPPNLPLGTGIGASQIRHPPGAPQPRTWHTMTDDAQLLIDRALVYLPPSFFALAGQQEAMPQLEGTFFVTTGVSSVTTDTDQTGSLATNDTIMFAEQEGVVYTVAQVTEKIVTLTSAYTGIDHNDTGTYNPNSNMGTEGNIGTKVLKKATSARRLSPSAANPPTNAQLAGPLAQFVSPNTAAPPPSPPLPPETVSAPTFLSNYFTRTLQMALANIAVTPQTITFI